VSHVFFAAYLLCFALGVGVVVLGFVLAARYRSRPMRLFTGLMGTGLLLLVSEFIRTYESVLRVNLGDQGRLFHAILGAAGAGAEAFLIPLFAFTLTAVPVSRLRRAVHVCLAAAAAILAVLQEYVTPEVSWRLTFLLLMGVHGYGWVVIRANGKVITDPRTRAIVDRLLTLIAVFFPVGIAQVVVYRLRGVPPFFADNPLEPLLYFLAVLIALYIFAGRYLFVPAPLSDYSLPRAMVELYGISSREQEIIPLVLQGYSHQEIADMLFISARTVKNHVYNIYQKTGVANRVLLMNLLFPHR
jgi:DNA-binding CsgD family transcriptional regulator